MHLRVPSTHCRGLSRRLVPALTVCLLAAGGCQPPADSAPEVALGWTVAPAPPVTGPATFSLTLTDTAAGQPVAGAAVRLEGNMSHAGMKPVFGTAREMAPGRYEAPLDFTMAGDWFVLVEARLRDGRTLQRQVDVRGVRPRTSR
ncbi:MAG TPA: FixH family protein [Thermoanaerobaculia bacterium]|nr:FixH family protein [Thermoanaerobaculia bacterium]